MADIHFEIFDNADFGNKNLRFSDAPAQEQRDFLKQNGYGFTTRYGGVWYPRTKEAKDRNADFVKEFAEKFYPENKKNFQPNQIEQLAESALENGSIEIKASIDNRIAYLENLIAELKEERKHDQEKISRLEAALENQTEENIAELEMRQEQAELDDETEWEKEILHDSEKSVDNNLTVSPKELAIAKSVLPMVQYVSTLKFAQGEEREFFVNKIKEIAVAVENAPKINATDGLEEHRIVLRYFHPSGTQSFITEIGKDGDAFGFQCLNDDWENAEWGYLNLDELKNIRGMEVDFHVPAGMTVERFLYKEAPEQFPKYAKFTNKENAPAQKLSSLDINSENYKEAFELLNRIEKLTGISELSEKINFAENEAKENFQPSPNVKTPEEFERMKKEIDNVKIVDESVENSETEKNIETQKEDVSYQDYTDGKVIYGKTVLPPFASMTSDGHLKTCENFVVKSYDSESGTYLVENENEKLCLPRETFNSLLNPAGLNREQQEEKTSRMEGNGIVFDNPEKGVKGTVIPEFSLMTQNGLQTYKDCVLTKFNESDKTYTLRNGDSIISVTEETFKEISSSERFENKFDENTPAYKKMLKTQYDDFFKERSNTAYNFRHNLSVFCRKEANSPCDALKVAKGIIQKMSPAEQDKTKNLLKKIAREGESMNQLIVRTYHEAIKAVPLNEEYIKQYQPENQIARPFYDTLSADGQKIDSDPQLLRTDKDYNLKIGDTLKDIDIKSDKIFGHGKENVHFSELKVISASKEGNTVTLMDKEKSFIEIPRDTVLKAYKEQQLKEMKHQQSHSRRNSMEISYR